MHAAQSLRRRALDVWGDKMNRTTLVMAGVAALVLFTPVAERAHAAVLAPMVEPVFDGFGTILHVAAKSKVRAGDLDNGPKNPGGSVNSTCSKPGFCKEQRRRRPTKSEISGPRPTVPPKP